jgi:hypothetical protein
MFRNDSWHSGVFDDGGMKPHNILKWSNVSIGVTYATPAIVDDVIYLGGGWYIDNDTGFNLDRDMYTKILVVGNSPSQVNYTAVVYPEYSGTVYRISNNESFPTINAGAGWGSSPSDSITWLIGDIQPNTFKAEYKGVFSFNFSNASIPTDAVFTSAMMRTLAYQNHPNTLGNTSYTVTQLNPPYQTSLNWTAYPYSYYNNTPLSDWIDQPVSNLNVDLNYTFNSNGLAYLQDTTSKSKLANLSVRSSWDTSKSYNGTTWTNNNETGIDTYGMNAASENRPYIVLNYYILQPLANFTTNVSSGNAPLAVQFTDLSTDSPTAWNWSFRNVTGNNTQVWFSTIKDPVHIFGAGNYSIVLNASNSAGYNISTQVTFLNVSASMGNDGIAIFRSASGNWYFDYNLDGLVDKSFRYGGVGDQILKGDWNGTGKNGIAIFRPSSGYWYFDYNLDGIVDKSFRYGGVGDQIIAGDWQGFGNEGIVIFRPSSGYWYFDYNLDGIVDKSFRYGGSTDQIITGKWA